MTRYVGLAAEGARHAASVQPSDVVELTEGALWSGGKDTKRKDIRLIGPALVVYFACCGGTTTELPEIRRRDFRPDRSQRILLPGTARVLAREVPLFGLSASKLQAYVSATAYHEDDESLFKDGKGNPLTGKSCWALFNTLGKRTELPGWRLPMILRSAFERWMEDCPSERVRLYLIGRKPLGTGGLPADATPKFTKVRDCLVGAHPLAKATRDELARPGAVRRAFPAPDFPALSREALSDNATRAKKGRIHPEVKTAIRTAVASGKSAIETARHYGTVPKTVNNLVKADGTPDPDPKPSQRSYRRTILQMAGTDAKVTASELTSKINAKYGSRLSRGTVKETARQLGVKLALEPRRGFWDRHETEFREAVGTAATPSFAETKARLAERGVKTTGLEYAFKKFGVELDPARQNRRCLEQAWPEIRRRLIANPGLTDKAIGEIVFETSGRRLGHTVLARFLAARHDMPARADNYWRGPRRDAVEIFERAWPSVRSAIVEDPRLTDRRIRRIVSATAGRDLGESALRHLLAVQPDMPPRVRCRRS